MRSKQEIRRYKLLTAICLILIALILIPFFSETLTFEVYIGVGVLALYLIYSILEAKALNSVVEEQLDDPIIGKEALVTEAFSGISGGFEGRVLVNGAPWAARSETQEYKVGDTASVSSLNGQVLQLK